MLKNLMNRYYYGKAGKADLTPDDLPTTRWQLFWETLRTHLAELVKLNLLQLVFWVPTIVVLLLGYSAMMNQMQLMDLGDGTSIQTKIVDEQALIRALQEGRIFGAGLDVFEKEPIPEDSELWDCPNLLITPHVAGDMFLPYTVQRIVDLFIEDFERYIRGEKPLRLVDLDKGY